MHVIMVERSVMFLQRHTSASRQSQQPVAYLQAPRQNSNHSWLNANCMNARQGVALAEVSTYTSASFVGILSVLLPNQS